MAVTPAEAVGLILGACLVAVVGYAGFLGGRDAAERKAAETIANLRRHNAVLRGQRDRAVEQSNRQARALGLAPTPVVAEPDWMSE